MSEASRPTAASVQDGMLAFVQQQGYECSGPFIADGKWHDLKDDRLKPGEGRKARYKLYADGCPNAIIHDFVSGETLHWKWSGHLPPSTPLERERQKEEAARRQAECARRQADEDTRKLAAALAIYQNASPHIDPDHPYRPKFHGMRLPWLRQDGADLYCPVYNWSGGFCGAQRINEKKKLLPGTKKSGQSGGHFLPVVGDWNTAGIIFIPEGLATGAAIHAARQDLNAGVIAAIDAGNLGRVAHTTRQHRPDALIVIAADFDQWKDPLTNPGLQAAYRAAKANSACLIWPRFDPRHHPRPDCTKGPTDFEDLLQLEGPEEVARQIKDQLRRQ